MEWTELTSIDQLDTIKNSTDTSVIFKHSTRCSVSLMAKRRFESDWEAIPAETPLYFLNLIAHRDVSNKIAEIFDVYHESPQILVIKNGSCVFDASHSEIDAEEIAGVIEK